MIHSVLLLPLVLHALFNVGAFFCAGHRFAWLSEQIYSCASVRILTFFLAFQHYTGNGFLEAIPYWMQ